MNHLIEARSLTKQFGDFTAVAKIDLHVDKGECFGLLGPNGAGKSTFINMIYGMALRSQGELKVFGLDPSKESREIKKKIGVVTQDNALDESLTVIENMQIYAAFIGMPKTQRNSRILELLEYMNLAHKKDSKIQALSGGMKRRLVFVRALLGQPELLILDEPTTGLDPAVRHLLWGKVKELHQGGTTILLTTHYMHEAEVLCERLVIMNQSKLVAEGSPQNLISKYTPGFVGLYDLDEKEKIQSISAQKSGLLFHQDSSAIYLRTNSLEELIEFHRHHSLAPLQIRPANLEDVFLNLTGQELSINA